MVDRAAIKAAPTNVSNLQMKKFLSQDKRVRYFALALAILFLVPYPKLRYRYFFETLSDSLHFPLFMLITLGFFCFFKEVKKEKLLFFLLILPVLIELIQPLFGRGASSNDLINGYLGIGIVLSFKIIKNFFIRLIIILGIFYLASIYIFLPLTLEYETLKIQKEKFPVLYDQTFQSSGFLNAIFWLPKDICLPCNSGTANQVTTLAHKFSGLEYKANGFDWSEYKKLKLKINLLNKEQILINIRIDDRAKCKEFEDRYNGQFELVKGQNTIEIPLQEVIHGPKTRLMDLSYVERMLIFTNPEETSLEFIIAEVSLE